MGKFLRSLTDGSLRCRYCGDRECNCMEEGDTQLGFVAIWQETAWSRLVQLKKQVLPNGKKIPSGHKIWIPTKVTAGVDEILKYITVTNDFVNRLRFD